jgi:hypothetical protein
MNNCFCYLLFIFVLYSTNYMVMLLVYFLLYYVLKSHSPLQAYCTIFCTKFVIRRGKTVLFLAKKSFHLTEGLKQASYTETQPVFCITVRKYICVKSINHGRSLAFEFIREIKLPFFHKILGCIVGYTYCNELDNTF